MLLRRYCAIIYGVYLYRRCKLKKLRCIMALCAFISVLMLSGCGQTSDNQFNLIVSKPWGDSVIEERMEYAYTMTRSDGTAAASGIYTVTVSVSDGKTRFKSSLDISYSDGGSASMQSLVIMDSSSLYPEYSEKTLENRTEGGEGYSLIMDYENLTSSMKFSSKDAPEEQIALSEPGLEVYDNEQLYQIVRAADNLTAKDNSGTFTIINGVDSYLYGEETRYSMLYVVGDALSVKAEGMANKYGVNADGNIPCRSVSIKINSDRSGPGTVIDYAAEKFEGGGRNVPVRITRSQYSTSSFDIEFTHTYVLKDYRTR